jgi:hypothetical protein
MKPTAIGLRGDAAVAAYNSGDPNGALDGIAKAIDRPAYCPLVVPAGHRPGGPRWSGTDRDGTGNL